MTVEEYLKELNTIKADIEANVPAVRGLDGAIAFAHHQRKLGMVQEMIDEHIVPENMLTQNYSVYDADFAIMSLLQRINAVGL